MPNRVFEIECWCCGATIEAGTTERRYCDSCRLIVRQQIERRYQESEKGRASGRRKSARWRQRHPEQYRAGVERYFSQLSVQAHYRKASRRRYWSDPERGRASAKERRKKNPEKVRRSFRRWYRRTYEVQRERYVRNAQERRARKRSLFVERISLRVVYRRDGGRCGICGRPAAWHRASLDHIVPLSHGGRHEYANVQLAHRLCNSRRRNVGPAQLRLRELP